MNDRNIRTVIQKIQNKYKSVHYFPSYEIITNPASRSQYFESNLRSVSSWGVSNVMKSMFKSTNSKINLDQEIICDEDLID